MKDLEDMTLEELWKLFPIVIEEHNPQFKDWYEMERQALVAALGGDILRIHHVGSTAVADLAAKPIIDILLEVSTQTDHEQLQKRLQSLDWLLMHATAAPQPKQTYNKGYTSQGFADRVYHLHVRPLDDWDELYFRDYLIDHPEIAREYGQLKLALKERYRNDRDAYTEAKTDFCRTYSEQARLLYGQRYRPTASSEA